MNKHLVTLPCGKTATRNSKSRVYTHCVAVRSSYQHALDMARTPRPVDLDNFRFYQRELDPATRKFPHSDKKLAEMAEIVALGSPEAYQARNVARAVARVEAARAEGHYETWAVLGWNGRLDLAQKLASGDGSHPRFAECRIIPTNFCA